MRKPVFLAFAITIRSRLATSAVYHMHNFSGIMFSSCKLNIGRYPIIQDRKRHGYYGFILKGIGLQTLTCT